MIKIKMSLSMVKTRIKKSGIEIFVERRLPDNTGTQIVTIFGHVVTLSTFMTPAQSFPRVKMENK